MDKQWLEVVSKLDPLVALEKEKAERVEELRSVLDTDRNFSISIEETENGLDIILKRDNNEDINLSHSLFPGYKFVESENFQASSLTQEVGFRKEELNNQMFLLSLFHEIGHTNNIDAKYFVLMKDAKKAKFHRIIRGIYLVMRYRTFFFLKKGKSMPKWYIKKKVNSVARDERDAWAFALGEMRWLQRQGYNVWNKDIMEFVKICLHSHEKRFVSTYLESGLGIDEEDKNIFLREFWDEVNEKEEKMKIDE